MNHSPSFEQRWQRAAASARGAATEACPELPFGFHTRVIAQWQAAPAEPWEDLLAVFGGRALWIGVAACIAAGLFVFADLYDSGITRPALEQNVSMEAWLPTW